MELKPATAIKPARNLPKNREGVFDEWAAVEKSQYETATLQHNKKRLMKQRLMELEYGRRNYIDDINR